MRKYTANYTYTNPNFVIQNLDYCKSESDMLPLLYVLKNLLQRGFPTAMSKFLQNKIGKIHEAPDYEERLLLVSSEPSHWFNTIKGGDDYNPAQYFFEQIIPNELGKYSFVQPMIIPEIGINEIIGTYNAEFVDQQVDFYLPQALLVIEIDGGQHAQNGRYDALRNEYFRANGIETVRIKTSELQNNNYQYHLDRIIRRIEQFENRGAFGFYKEALEKSQHNAYSEEEIHNKMLPTAVIRFQILLLELLAFERIHFGEPWCFNILCDEPIKDFARLAIEDTYIWLNQLVRLRDKHELPKFDYKINISTADKFQFDPKAVNIDFSLLKRYTDEDRLDSDIIFVRSDYFDFSSSRNLLGLDKNYFEVSTAPSINYNVTDDDKPILRFFLQNLFNKKDFRDGQFSIIANALNLQDTVGLLPTGGGKSLCYQMPCLLQPSINFVVCPIKSLMYDQIDNLKRGDVAITNINLICGDLSAADRTKIMENYARGKYLFIWISPERFQIKSFRTTISQIIQHFNISYAVIDEVHCMSEWGHDFRTSYLNLTKTIDALSPKDNNGEGIIKYIGLTATASVNVLKDIRVEFSRRKQQLDDDNIKTLIDYTRPELDFIVVDDQRNKEKVLLTLFTQNGIPDDHKKASLIFTPYVNGKSGCYELAGNLNSKFPQQVAWYSGSCPSKRQPNGSKLPVMSQAAFDKYKTDTQAAFKDDRYQVLCATKAFGMGIDKQNIFYTFHYGLPASVESLYQEAGRAGRWDKREPENKGKRGKCYVLHSHETPQTAQLAERLFVPNLDVATMNGIMKQVGWNGEDIFRQMFLFLGNLPPVDTEFNHIIQIIDRFFCANDTRTISYDEIRHIGVFMSPDMFEKYIYRLCLLGIADDWTQDFISQFTVHFNSCEPEHIIASLKSYIEKYAPEEKVEENIMAVSHPLCDTTLKKAVWYLLDWIFRHITETRKQSLKTLSDWCLDYKDSASFKKRLDSYFTFNESTYVLQHIAEHAFDYKQWFAVFYWVDKEGNRTNRFITPSEQKKLRDRLSRFLESYHNSPGIDFVSGIVRALLNEFDDVDGRVRFEHAMQAIANHTEEDNSDFIDGIIPFLKDAHLSTEMLAEVGAVIAQYLPNLADTLADTFEMPWIFNDIIREHINSLHQLNKTLYEQIGRIQQ